MWTPGQPTPKAVSSPAPASNDGESTTRHEPFKDNLIAALAYFTFIPAVIFVLVAPFKKNRFIRFHSWQSILLTIAAILLAILMRALYSILALIPVAGFLLAWLTTGVLLFGFGILWLVLLIKALQGDAFHLPVIGKLADSI